MPDPLAATPPMPVQRQERLSTLLRATGLDAVVLNPGPSLTYLTGLHFHLSERPVLAFFTSVAAPTLVLPELETAKIRDLPFDIQAFTYGEDPASWQDAFSRAARNLSLDGRRLGVEPQGLRFLELGFLQEALPAARFASAEEALSGLRMYKDPAELDLMRRAVRVAQESVAAALAEAREGMTEKDLAAELTLQMLRRGSQPELPFAPIIAFGSESANPHANPRDRALRPGDLVLIDWGANVDGYFSDLTRMFSFGEVDDELADITRIVGEANEAARQAAGPDVRAEDVDRAARRVIEEAGYGEQFIHRTGHGLGLQVHEEPYIRAGHALRLAPGMTFTIEPGIYLSGRGGARVEDDVVVTADGAESLSDLPRGLVPVESFQ